MNLNVTRNNAIKSNIDLHIRLKQRLNHRIHIAHLHSFSPVVHMIMVSFDLIKHGFYEEKKKENGYLG